MSKYNLHTEDDYRIALIRFLEIFEAEENTPEYQEYLMLVESIELYENENC